MEQQPNPDVRKRVQFKGESHSFVRIRKRDSFNARLSKCLLSRQNTIPGSTDDALRDTPTREEAQNSTES